MKAEGPQLTPLLHFHATFLTDSHFLALINIQFFRKIRTRVVRSGEDPVLLPDRQKVVGSGTYRIVF